LPNGVFFFFSDAVLLKDAFGFGKYMLHVFLGKRFHHEILSGLSLEKGSDVYHTKADKEGALHLFHRHRFDNPQAAHETLFIKRSDLVQEDNGVNGEPPFGRSDEDFGG
jgi:hypothetical protein